MLREILQFAALSGSALSLLIVICILRIGSPHRLTFLNQMFFVYYSIDSVFGTFEIHFLFKLKEER